MVFLARIYDAVVSPALMRVARSSASSARGGFVPITIGELETEAIPLVARNHMQMHMEHCLTRCPPIRHPQVDALALHIAAPDRARDHLGSAEHIGGGIGVEFVQIRRM